SADRRRVVGRGRRRALAGAPRSPSGTVLQPPQPRASRGDAGSPRRRGVLRDVGRRPAGLGLPVRRDAGAGLVTQPAWRERAPRALPAPWTQVRRGSLGGPEDQTSSGRWSSL